VRELVTKAASTDQRSSAAVLLLASNAETVVPCHSDQLFFRNAEFLANRSIGFSRGIHKPPLAEARLDQVNYFSNRHTSAEKLSEHLDADTSLLARMRKLGYSPD
jgi:hypothetical protein